MPLPVGHSHLPHRVRFDRKPGRLLAAAIIVALAGLSHAGPTHAASQHQIPGSIADDCSVDVTQPILSWFASVPDSSTLSFGTGACYRVDGMLELNNRNGLVFEGNGATFKAFTTGSPQRAHWRLIGGSNLVLRNMTIQGAHPSPGTPVEELQWQHGVDLRGVTNVDIGGVSVVSPYGDCIYIGRAWEASSPWTTNARVHDSSCNGAGRQGVAVTAGRNVMAERIYLSHIALNAFDVEPNGAGSGAANVTFRNSHVAAPLGHNVFVVLGSGPVDGVTVAHNTLTGKGMYMALLAPPGERRSNFTITGNSSDTGLLRPGAAALDFQRIDGLTARGNTIPLSGPNMALASIRESCDVSISGNRFPGGVTESRRFPHPCTPPQVRLTAPRAGYVFSSRLAMGADVRADNPVSKVEFLANRRLVKTDQTPPYTFTWRARKRKTGYGRYRITARAVDASGLSARDTVAVKRLRATSTKLHVAGAVRAGSRGRTASRRAYGRVRGSRSGRAMIRLERLERVSRDWVKVRTRRVRLRGHGRFRVRLKRLETGRWRARVTFKGTRTRAPSKSPYRHFRVG